MALAVAAHFGFNTSNSEETVKGQVIIGYLKTMRIHHDIIHTTGDSVVIDAAPQGTLHDVREVLHIR